MNSIEKGKIYKVQASGLIYFEMAIGEVYVHGRFLDDTELFYVESDPEVDQDGTINCTALLENGFMVNLEIIGHMELVGSEKKMVYSGFELFEGEMKKFEQKPVEFQEKSLEEMEYFGLWE